jgi:hypothetical protein
LLNIFRGEQGKYPLAEFNIQEGNGVCKNPKAYNISPGRTNYKLLRE